MALTLEEMASMPFDALAAELGENSTRGGLPLDFQHYKRVGMALFEAIVEDIRDIICPMASQITATADSDPETVARDAAFVVDLLLATHGDLPLGTVSVMIIKYGVGHLCGSSMD